MCLERDSVDIPVNNFAMLPNGIIFPEGTFYVMIQWKIDVAL
jgi:hypothetical protein